jgi:cyclic pyranopterin phosphate synthase
MIDPFGRTINYLRLSVTPRCSLSCLYCRPGHCPAGAGSAQSGPAPSPRQLTVSEIDRLTRVLTELGIDRIRLTGGEPLLRPDLEAIIRRIRSCQGVADLSLTTNGQDLAARAWSLKKAGLMRVNISLDSLRADRFTEITGSGSLARALAGIDASLAAGLFPVKLNTVLLRGINDDELEQLFLLTRDRPLALRLIELMPMNDLAASGEHLMTGAEILSRYPQLVRVPDQYPGQPAQDYRLPGYQGTIGLICPISQPFCSDCNRIRITADGHVKGCLGQDEETDLTPWLDQPDDAALARALLSAVASKPAGHPFARHMIPARSMDRTGG